MIYANTNTEVIYLYRLEIPGKITRLFYYNCQTNLNSAVKDGIGYFKKILFNHD